MKSHRPIHGHRQKLRNRNRYSETDAERESKAVRLSGSVETEIGTVGNDRFGS